MRVVEPTEAVVVLGSTQPEAVVASGVRWLRRRSGGGAVLVEPGGLVWVDVFVPAGDPLWEDDVGRAFLWLGRAWADALGGAAVHEGPLVTTRWSPLVCFAGLGPGEVTLEGAKVVGLCQRRTRAGALFQCAALLEWRPDRLLERLAVGAAGAEELAGVARGVDADPEALTEGLLDRLP